VYVLRTGATLTAQTDAAGRATFENLPARELNVSVNFAPVDYLPPGPAKATPAGQELRLVCRTATRITGVVVDGDGRPLPLSAVSAVRGDAHAGWAQVDKDGRFTMLLPSDETAPVRLEIDRDHDGKIDASLDGVLPGAQDVRLVVKK
jgi:hypothetical protein